VGILPGQKCGSARRADRIRDERIGEPGAGRGQPVEVRRRIDLRAVAGDCVLGMVVGEDEEDGASFEINEDGKIIIIDIL
jgi:hypothetical protein